jgi:hypothetical protein
MDRRLVVRRLRRPRERGAQSLEWLALGSFVLTLMAGATAVAHGAGADLGHALVNHLQGFIQQP